MGQTLHRSAAARVAVRRAKYQSREDPRNYLPTYPELSSGRPISQADYSIGRSKLQ